jgi:hypothetical protein
MDHPLTLFCCAAGILPALIVKTYGWNVLLATLIGACCALPAARNPWSTWSHIQREEI